MAIKGVSNSSKYLMCIFLHLDAVSLFLLLVHVDPQPSLWHLLVGTGQILVRNLQGLLPVGDNNELSSLMVWRGVEQPPISFFYPVPLHHIFFSLWTGCLAFRFSCILIHPTDLCSVGWLIYIRHLDCLIESFLKIPLRPISATFSFQGSSISSSCRTGRNYISDTLYC